LKKVVISVTNDLLTDRRVEKLCNYLIDKNFKITLIGRELPNSLSLKRNYKTIRMKLFFNHSFLFYAEYNIRLFFILLTTNFDLLVSNDLDTLPANFLAKIIKSKPIVYDSHEYFTGVPEIQKRPFVKWVWSTIEKNIFPKLTDIITVNKSIAKIYNKKYNKQILVVRNISNPTEKQKIPNDFPNKDVIILQGSGINIDRGAEEAVEAMQYIENAVLLIIGKGDVIEKLKTMRKDLKLTDKVIIKDQLPYIKMMAYTQHATIGLSLDKATSKNYLYSLPNKLFDYIHAKTPVLASNVVEVKKIIEYYKIGKIIKKHNPKHIAKEINSMLEKKGKWQDNLKIASYKLTWDKEVKKLDKIYLKF